MVYYGNLVLYWLVNRDPYKDHPTIITKNWLVNRDPYNGLS